MFGGEDCDFAESYKITNALKDVAAIVALRISACPPEQLSGDMGEALARSTSRRDGFEKETG